MERRPRSPGIVYSALGSALLLTLGFLSFTADQPPPPTIAEFAPQAQELIEDAPPEQSSEFGSGEGATTTSEASLPQATPAVVPPPVEVPRIRRCVGDPPRQIEDPQSPPCVPYWAGDNGGGTTPGVSATEVRIGIPHFRAGLHPLLEAFFNRRFEFYGRKLTFVDLGFQKGGGNPEEWRADAKAADEQHDLFATSIYARYGGFDFYDEIARREIIAVTDRPQFTTSWLRDRSPYIWAYPMEADQIFAQLGHWACSRLSNNNAEHAGRSDVEDLTTKKRSFGIVLQAEVASNDALSMQPLEDALASCNEKAAVAIDYGDTDYADTQKANNVVIKMKQEGVTSIFCLCHALGGSLLARAATSQNYEPEWLVNTYLFQDVNWGPKTFWPAEQRPHMFGLTFGPKQVPPDDQPVRWAATEIDPSSDIGASPTKNDDVQDRVTARYRALLLLASGVQMAGPDLTPETFRQALQSTVFPNPDHPNMAGDVGFQGNSFAMTTDAAEIWWSESATDPDPGQGIGAYCYVQGGTRHRTPDWPSESTGFFTPACDSGTT